MILCMIEKNSKKRQVKCEFTTQRVGGRVEPVLKVDGRIVTPDHVRSFGEWHILRTGKEDKEELEILKFILAICGVRVYTHGVNGDIESVIVEGGVLW